MHVYMCDCMCESMHVCRGWCWMTSSVTLYFIYWVRVFHWIWPITVSLAGQIAFGILPLPDKCWGYRQLPCLPSSYKSSIYLNSGLHVCAWASTFSSKPSLQYFFNGDIYIYPILYIYKIEGHYFILWVWL